MDRAMMLESLATERHELEALLPTISDDRWRDASREDGWSVHHIVTHLADSTYGLALLALGEIKPALPFNQQTGWMDVDGYNEDRRQKNASLSREKAMQRLSSAYDHARRAIEQAPDLGAPGPYGDAHTVGLWLQRIIDHTRDHRQELAALAV